MHHVEDDKGLVAELDEEDDGSLLTTSSRAPGTRSLARTRSGKGGRESISQTMRRSTASATFGEASR